MNTSLIEIPGLSIACKLWGNPHHPTILALHGWLDNANSFDYLAPYLQHKYHIIAVDLPGHGYSSHLAEGTHYHFIDGAFTIIQIMNALQLDKVHLLGHSLGACLASIAGGIASERFLSIGLIEGLGPFTQPEETSSAQLSNYLEKIAQSKPRTRKGYKQFADAASARALKGYVSLEIASTLCERGLVKKQGAYYWRHDNRLLIPSPLLLTEQQVLSCLKNIRVKTYLFWASKGFSFNYQLMQGRIRAVRDLKIARMEGGHHVHMEKPEAVANLLDHFYKSL